MLHSDRDAPRGAIVLWTSDTHGHMALSKGDQENFDIMSTDPYGNWGATGTMPQKWPEQNWGQKWAGWTTHYAGVDLPMDTIPHGDVYLSKLRYGQEDSDSVKRLQWHLNAHPLDGGATLPVTGNYGDLTDAEVIKCQTQHGYGSDPAGASSVGPQQAAHLIPAAGCDCVLVDDLDEEVPPLPAGGTYWYSGKPAGTLTVGDSYTRLDVDKWAPEADGLIFGMVYLNVSTDTDAEFKVRLIRDPDDATAYQTFYAVPGDHFLVTHVWFEWAEAGRALWWEISCADGGDQLRIGTRYAKFAQA